MTDKIVKKLSKFILIIIALLFVVFIFIGVYFITNISPVNEKDNKKIEFVIEPGSSKNNVILNLEKEGLIKNAFVVKLYLKINGTKDFMAGRYSLSKSMDIDEIVESFTSGKNILDDSLNITFVEGKKFPYYAKKISEVFPYSEDDVINKCKDKEFLNTLINDYWFITDEILNDKLYYPLEGYIFPDTYTFKNDATIEDIIRKMLDGMSLKLEPFKEELSGKEKEVHSLLTLSSMVELEAVTAEDRFILAGLFNNRIKKGMTLGSDVTTYYAARKEMTESLTISDLNDCNAYNTRGICVNGLPVGPICSPSKSSIEAAMNPKDTEYYYFVADTHNKLYFGRTIDEHNKNISDLKKSGLWPE